MTEQFGHKWTSAFGEDAVIGAGRTWGVALVGITASQLADGLKACVVSGSEWPPTPGQFREMCLSIPSLAAVRGMMLENPRPRFARFVMSFVDLYRFTRADQQQADRMIADAYEQAREQVMLGGEVPADVAAIDHDAKQAQIDSEAAERKRYDDAHMARNRMLMIELHGSEEAYEAAQAKWIADGRPV